MGETRVEIRHLLEDLRDAYPFPEEEVVVTELIANALDSGAGRVSLTTEFSARRLTVLDDGAGMTLSMLKRYHDIAATTKHRGRGIGFAGVGAKLALLLAEAVITETRRGRFHRATRWRLDTPRRAPWNYFPPSGLVPGPHGTAVTVIASEKTSPLLKPDYLERLIAEHFTALLSPEMAEILKTVYPRGTVIEVNGRPVVPLDLPALIGRKTVWVRAPGAGRMVGLGFVARAAAPLPDAHAGIAVSAYGKTIKRGWDWLGITPRSPRLITGLIEVPRLVDLLTTNKADFLKDGTSLRKYYLLRKAIQQAVEPVLREFGELAPPAQTMKKSADLGRRFERVIDGLMADFPELSPLLGRRLAGVSGEPKMEAGAEVVAADPFAASDPFTAEPEKPAPASPPGDDSSTHLSPEPQAGGPEDLSSGRRSRRPGIKVAFEDNPVREDLARLEEDQILINRIHPAWVRAVRDGSEEYHVALCIAWVLAGYLELEKSPRGFIDRFLAKWGDGEG